MAINLPPKLILHFDGATEPVNPGGWSTYGWILSDENKKIITSGRGVAASKGSKFSTNNHAEYCALGFALRFLEEQQWCGDLEIYGDSQLVVNQVNSQWNCNSEHLQKLRARVWVLLEKVCNKYSISWIKREQNEKCDKLSRLAYIENCLPRKKKR